VSEIRKAAIVGVLAGVCAFAGFCITSTPAGAAFGIVLGLVIFQELT